MLQYYDFSDSMLMNIIMIKRALSGGELLPNLRHFETDTPLLKWIPLFVHKGVSSLSLEEGRANAGVFMQTVSYLPDLCPSLQNLTLLVNTVPSVALDAVFSSLPLLKKVKLSTSALPLAALNTLARLPHLESLSIVADIDDDNEGFDLPIMPLPDAFPSLTAFSSEKISFCLIVSFLEAYRPRALRSLSVVSPNHESYESYCSLCDTVVSTAPNMDKIYMYCREHLCEAGTFSIPLFPSAPHRRLNITSLELPIPPPLDVGGLRTLLTSLPSLVTLELGNRAGPPTIPLSALSELAPLCPAMRHLTMHLDTKALPASAPPHQTFQRLQVLNIGRSPLQSLARDVAAFLGAVLRPMCVLCHSHLDPKEGAKWEPVAEFLPLMQELQAARKALAATLPAQ
ncbi:hypothetical protein EYR40_011126 [Pleurotus pulmonarius]|nr:hypothetical protein EYR36_002896 [Pleurotus pulmonarius]KAF4587105.1 hypothetical protein EYR40_011126 [Pleurotus pulmonarius]